MSEERAGNGRGGLVDVGMEKVRRKAAVHFVVLPH